MAAMRLDLIGLRCPLPALRTEKALRAMKPGDRLEVLADDPLASLDIPHLCQEAGHRLVESSLEGTARRFVIEKGRMNDAAG